MSDRIVSIGLGEFSVSGDPETVLVGYGLGSCVGLTLYDPELRVGGMAHVVLPERIGDGHDDAGAKFADGAVDRLIAEMERLGCRRSRMVVKMAGGGRLLSLSLNGQKWDIGDRNVAALRVALQRNGLTVSRADVGGNYGRTMRFLIADGRVVVSTIGRGEQVL